MDVVLTLKQKQVVAFVAAYLHEYGCLPSPPEVAQGCGFRAPRTAARALDELEELGVLRREPTNTRLGEVDLRDVGRTVPEQHQLWLCERTCIEYEFWLRSVRRGLDLAEDLDTITALHNEGVSRATTLRAFRDACTRLEDGGAALDASAHAALAGQHDLVEAALAMLTDWPAYCVVQLVWSLSAHQWLSTLEPMTLGYAGSCFVASRRTTEALLPTYWSRAAGPLGSDPRVQELIAELSALLTRLRTAIADHFPPTSAHQHVDASTLLTTWSPGEPLGA